jgi:hypothetical protein
MSTKMSFRVHVFKICTQLYNFIAERRFVMVKCGGKKCGKGTGKKC